MPPVQKISGRILITAVCCLLFLSFLLAGCSGKKDVRPAGPFDPEKSMALANELIEKKEYEDARRILLEVKNRDLSKNYAPLAQLKIADSFAREEEYDLAVEEYKRFLDIYPDHKNTSYAQYQIAMTYFSQIEGHERGYGAAAKALSEFEKLKRLYPRNPYRELIEVRIEQCRTIIADYEFLVGEFYFKKGSYNAALGRFTTVLTKFPEYKKEPAVLYHIAVCHKRLGDTEQALAFAKRLSEKYPGDRYARDAEKEFSVLKK